MRKATFTRSGLGYAPVNKLAKSLCGSRSSLDASEAREIAKDKLARVYLWTDAGLRQSFRG